MFLSVIFRTILYPIGASGQGYCCTALGRDECVGIKASGGSDILVTKLRRYRCYAYSILWVSKLPIYRRLGQACERRARLLEESRARKKTSNNPLPLRHFSTVELRCKCGCGAGMEKSQRSPYDPLFHLHQPR